MISTNTCKPVTTLADFKNKYGTRGWKILIEDFIKRAPTFNGDEKLASYIGEITADLESILKEEK